MLLTLNNKKLLKSKAFGYLQVGLHLAPYNLSGYNVCKFATKSCKATCLFSAGLGGLDKIKQARIAKTKLFFENKEEFLLQLSTEIFYYKMIATNKGLKLAVRLNLTSDIDWQKEYVLGKSLFEHHPSVQFLDYTKDYGKQSLFTNYDLTYSYDAINHSKAEKLSKNENRVAVVFEKGYSPSEFLGKKVVNGDIHDLTFLHDKNVILGLSYKNVVSKGVNNKELVKQSTLVVKREKHENI